MKKIQTEGNLVILTTRIGFEFLVFWIDLLHFILTPVSGGLTLASSASHPTTTLLEIDGFPAHEAED